MLFEPTITRRNRIIHIRIKEFLDYVKIRFCKSTLITLGPCLSIIRKIKENDYTEWY